MRKFFESLCKIYVKSYMCCLYVGKVLFLRKNKWKTFPFGDLLWQGLQRIGTEKHTSNALAGKQRPSGVTRRHAFLVSSSRPPYPTRKASGKSWKGIALYILNLDSSSSNRCCSWAISACSCCTSGWLPQVQRFSWQMSVWFGCMVLPIFLLQRL